MFHFFIKIALFIVVAVSLHAHNGFSQKHLLGISTDEQIEIRFDLEIIQESLRGNVIELKQINQRKKISGKTVVKDGKTLVFIPDEKLLAGTYKLDVDPIKLQKCLQHYDSWFQKLFFKDKCSVITTPIKYAFELKINEPSIIALDLNQTSLHVKEGNQTILGVIALYDNNATKDVTQNVEWVVDDSSIIAVNKGEFSAIQEGTTTIQAIYEGIKSSELNVTVYKEVNGYILPLEPDETLNNSTLLGIDSNNNGVRDDVERWIFLEMKIYNGYEKIEQAIAMQEAKANQMALKDPTNKDDLVHKAINASIECWVWYDYSKQVHSTSSLSKFSRALDDKFFNTRERLKTYWEYDNTLRGRIFTSTPTLQTKSQCETDIDEL